MTKVRDYDQFMLRLPDGVREEIKASAERNDRSMNAEILARVAVDPENLRDKFAMAALAGLIPAYQAAYGSPTAECMEIVREAYGYADIMLATRKGGAQ